MSGEALARIDRSELDAGFFLDLPDAPLATQPGKL